MIIIIVDVFVVIGLYVQGVNFGVMIIIFGQLLINLLDGIMSGDIVEQVW